MICDIEYMNYDIGYMIYMKLVSVVSSCTLRVGLKYFHKNQKNNQTMKADK